jgi:zinc transport system substrate-binding protein
VRSRIAWIALLTLVACSGEPAEVSGGATEPGRLVVFATSYPLAYFAERIGGDATEVLFPVPAGVDPAHWNADPETIAQAQAADLLLRHGAGDPAWLDLASLHRDRVVDTTAHVRERLLTRETVQHQHGPEGDHSHGERAGTTWLDPTLALAQAEALTDALVARLPEREASLRFRLATLRDELTALDAGLRHAATSLGDTPLLFSHPVYDYLQARYGLNARSVSWEPDAVPSEAQWRALGALRVEHPARLMLWEAAPLPEVAERLTQLGVEPRVYAPCANRPESGDWLDTMRTNLDVLEALVGGARRGERV